MRPPDLVVDTGPLSCVEWYDEPARRRTVFIKYIDADCALKVTTHTADWPPITLAVKAAITYKFPDLDSPIKHYRSVHVFHRLDGRLFTTAWGFGAVCLGPTAAWLIDHNRLHPAEAYWNSAFARQNVEKHLLEPYDKRTVTSPARASFHLRGELSW